MGLENAANPLVTILKMNQNSSRVMQLCASTLWKKLKMRYLSHFITFLIDQIMCTIIHTPIHSHHYLLNVSATNPHIPSFINALSSYVDETQCNGGEQHHCLLFQAAEDNEELLKHFTMGYI